MNIKITKTHLVLFGIFFLALVLRIVAALHAPMGADEEAYSTIPIDIISAGRLGTVEQSTLYFYLLDAGYSVFGVDSFSTRLPSILFGSLAVILVFFFVQELFGKKEGLIAAFIFAVSGYALRFNMEMDMAAFFFVLLAMLLFVKGMKNGNKWMLYGCAAALALAVMIKNITALFIPAFAAVWVWGWWKEQKTGQNKFLSLKVLILACGVFLALLLPIFAYNYLTYTENGTTDYYFSVVLGVGKSVYSGLEGEGWVFSGLVSRSQGIFGRYFEADPALLLFGIFSLGFVLWKFKRFEHKEGMILMISGTLLFYLYMAGNTGSSSHYLWLPIVFAVCSSFVLGKLKARHIAIVLAVLFVFNMFLLKDIMLEKYSVLSLRDYVNDEIPANALVVVDPRIYRGVTAWAFNDKHYLEGSYFPKLVELANGAEGARITYPVYYVECGKETTCTWSTEDYQRVYNFSEDLTAAMKKNTVEAARITGGGAKPGDRHVFIIHKGMIELPAGVLEAADSTHIYWFYPVRWKGQIMDKYDAQGIGVLLNALGFIVLYIELVMVLLVIPATILILFRRGGENG